MLDDKQKTWKYEKKEWTRISTHDWRAPKSRGETHLRVSQSQVAES